MSTTLELKINEDYSVINLLQDYLLIDKDVIFVGISKDHPSDNMTRLKITLKTDIVDNISDNKNNTLNESSGKIEKKLKEIISKIIKNLNELKNEFNNKIK